MNMLNNKMELILIMELGFNNKCLKYNFKSVLVLIFNKNYKIIEIIIYLLYYFFVLILL